MKKEEQRAQFVERLMGMSEVAELLAVSRRQVYRMVASGALPKPVRQGSRSVLFLSDIQAYLTKLREERDGRR